MCCVISALIMAGPRLAIFIWWLVDKLRFEEAFNGILWPIVGFLFAPWTTLAYLFVYSNGVNGLDWLWIAIGILIDLGAYTSGGYGSRRRGRG
jgi:hypothetical protein